MKTIKSKIIKQEKNPFMQREEIILEIISESVPSEAEVISAVGKNSALTVVKKINTNFGRQSFLSDIFVYENIEARERIETIPQKIRKKIAAEKKAEEEAAKKKAEAEIKAAKEAEETAKAEKETAKAEKATEEEKPEEKKSTPTNNEDKSAKVTE